MKAVWDWWRAKSINEQNALIEKYFPWAGKTETAGMPSRIGEIYQKVHGLDVNPFYMDR